MTETLFSKLDAHLVHKGSGKSLFAKKWSNNTKVMRSYVTFDTIKVRLHHTDIVCAERNGDITLNTGGYRTVTTKARINEFLKLVDTGWQVYQKNYVWRIAHYAGGGNWDVTAEFEDGMTLYANTEPAPVDPQLQALLDEEEEIAMKASTYEATQQKVKKLVYAEIIADPQWAKFEELKKQGYDNVQEWFATKGWPSSDLKEGPPETTMPNLHAPGALGMAVPCSKCGDTIYKLDGQWVDASLGDCCNEDNGVHQAAAILPSCLNCCATIFKDELCEYQKANCCWTADGYGKKCPKTSSGQHKAGKPFVT